MKLPRIRITVRRLMVVVAMVGALLGTLIAVRASRVRQANQHRLLSTTREQRRLHGTSIPDSTWTAKKLWHAEMSNKYERAARSPWLPVGPDPPEPN